MDHVLINLFHILAGLIVVCNFMMIYQKKVTALIKIFSWQSFILAMAVATQAYLQKTPHLYITVLIAIVLKGFLIPYVLNRIIEELKITQIVDSVFGGGLNSIIAVSLVVLSLMLLKPVIVGQTFIISQELVFSLATILLSFWMMISRSNIINQIIGFMCLENGLVLGCAAVNGMPLVVEISIAVAVLSVFIICGIFVFRVKDNFETLDVGNFNEFRGGK